MPTGSRTGPEPSGSPTGDCQVERGIDHIPSNDFSLYDHVLDTAVMVGAIPPRFRRQR